MINEETTCYTEIVTLDTYKLLSLDFRPDVIFDIGANLGVFTVYAHGLFPDARIVAVEPHPANFAALVGNAPDHNAVLLEKAIGIGPILRYPDIRNDDDGQVTTAETYISAGDGYVLPDIADHPLLAVATEGVMLDALYDQYVKPGDRVVIKIDCEGAENVLFVHPPSIEALRRADFVSMELHPYWATRQLYQWAAGQPHEDDATLAARVAGLFASLHECTSEPPMFYARKRS